MSEIVNIGSVAYYQNLIVFGFSVIICALIGSGIANLIDKKLIPYGTGLGAGIGIIVGFGLKALLNI